MNTRMGRGKEEGSMHWVGEAAVRIIVPSRSGDG